MSTHHNAYPVFEGDQVLTATHLNSLRVYLESQTLASRKDLVGTGIVSGLRIESVTKTGLLISEGIGVTGRGYLIRLATSECRYLARYTDTSSSCGCGSASTKEDGVYTWFQKDEKHLPVWELLTETEANERRESGMYPIEINDNQEIILSGGDTDTVISLDQHLLTLYLEREDEDLEDCFGDDCDEKGVRRSFSVRKLLVPGPDIYASVPQPEKKAPFINMRRPGFSDVEKDYSLTSLISYGAMKKAYLSAINQTVQDLEEAVPEVWDHYHKLLERGLPPAWSMVEWKKQGILKDRMEKIFNRHPYAIQRHYDCLRFVIKAWNECVEALDQTGRLQQADHPRHLVIGEPVLADPVEPVRYRHVFQSAPAQKKQMYQAKRAIILFRRFIELIRALDSSGKQGDKIVIQPSQGKNVSLAKQPKPGWISDSDNDHLDHVWDPDYFIFERSEDQKDAYFSFYDNDPTAESSIDVNAEKHGFYRIEGHVGMSFNDALEKLESERQRLNMPVKIIGLKLGKKAHNLAFDSECRFDDLDQQYNVLVVELNCLFNEEIAFFSNLKIKTKEEEKKEETEAGPEKEDPGKGIGLPGFYEAYDVEISRGDVLSGSEEMSIKSQDGNQVLMGSSQKVTAKDFYSNKQAASQAHDGATFVLLNQDLKQPVATGVITTSDLIADQINTYQELDIIRVIDAYPELVLNPEIVNILIGKPVQLANRIRILLQVLPEKPADLELDRISEAFDSLVTLALSYKEDVLKSENHFSGQKGMILYRLDKLVHNCGIEKLKAIHSWYKERIEQYSQLRLLHKFAERHSGMEHLSGVPAGGTLVLVYVDENEVEETSGGTIWEPFPLKPSLSDLFQPTDVRTRKELHISERDASVLLRDFRSVANSIKLGGARPDELSRIDDIEKDLQKRIEELIKQPGKTPEISKKVVVADFALPYLYKSGCPELNMMVLSRITFTLPQTRFCKKDSTRYPFVADPAGGTIESSGGGVVADGNRYYFVPSEATIDEGALQFTYIMTNQKVVFHAELFDPVAKFDFTAKPGGVVVFENQSLRSDNYKWDLGDGNSTEEPDPVITYKKSDASTVIVTLTAKKGGCQHQVAKKAPLLWEEEVDFFLDQKEGTPKNTYCQSEEELFRFHVHPEGEEIKGDDLSGIEKTRDGYFLDPSAYKPGTYHFTYKEKKLSVKILEAPAADFTYMITNETKEEFEVMFVYGGSEKTNVYWQVKGYGEFEGRKVEVKMHKKTGSKADVVLKVIHKNGCITEKNQEVQFDWKHQDEDDRPEQPEKPDEPVWPSEPDKPVDTNPIFERMLHLLGEASDLKIEKSVFKGENPILKEVEVYLKKIQLGIRKENERKALLTGEKNPEIIHLFEEKLQSSIDFLKKYSPKEDAVIHAYAVSVYLSILMIFIHLLATQINDLGRRDPAAAVLLKQGDLLKELSKTQAYLTNQTKWSEELGAAIGNASNQEMLTQVLHNLFVILNK